MGGGFFRSMFGGGGRTSECQPLPEPVETDLNRSEPVTTDMHRLDTHWQVPTRRRAEPEEHAAALLEVLQAPGGRTGSIPVDDLKAIHVDMCLEVDWEIINWIPVGRELRRLLGAEKTYDKGKRVYRIPPIAGRSRLRAV